MKPQLHHVDIITEELEASVRFYRETLGMVVAGWFYREDLFEFVFLRDQLGEANFSIEFCGPPLLEWQAQMLAARGPCMDHFSFVADDIDRWYEELARREVTFVQPPEAVLGAREMYFKDPSGVVLEIITPSDPALTPMELPNPKASDGISYRLRKVTIIEDDLAGAAAFYSRALMLETVGATDIGSGRVLLTDQNLAAGRGPRAMLELKAAPGLSDYERDMLGRYGPGLYGIGFDVKDIKAAHDDLLSKGVDAELEDRGEAARLLIYDPNGIQITIKEED